MHHHHAKGASGGNAGPSQNLPALDDRGGAGSKTKSPEIQRANSGTAGRSWQAVYDGRTALGAVKLIDGRYVAVASTGEIVGFFHTLAEAARSLPARGAS